MAGNPLKKHLDKIKDVRDYNKDQAAKAAKNREAYKKGNGK